MDPLRLTELAQTGRKARDTPLCRRDRGADSIGLMPDLKPCVAFRHPRRGDRKLRETVDLADRLAVKPALRLEVRRLTGDPHRMARGAEGGDRAAATFSSQEPTPGCIDIWAERRNSAQASHDDAPLTAHQSLIPRWPGPKAGQKSGPHTTPEHKQTSLTQGWSRSLYQHVLGGVLPPPLLSRQADEAEDRVGAARSRLEQPGSGRG